MCDFTKEFKLCSCDANNLPDKEIGWILKRLDESLPMSRLKGKVAVKKFSSSELALKENMIKNLNKGNCFDFAYTPQEGDFLKIRVKEDGHAWFAFRYERGEWVDDRSNSLTGWRSQLVDYGEGTVE